MIMPYLNFDGDCEEAFRLYQRAFGGQEPVFARYGEGPDDPAHPMDEAQKTKIMHGYVALTETEGISGADALLPVEKGLAPSIHVNCSGIGQGQQAFRVLAEEGAVVDQLQPDPFSRGNELRGSVRDKYGFTWVISAQSGGSF